MCIAPNTLDDGLQVACHKCWQCREHAINDWVGRNIAESKTAKASHAVTLTYGRNSANDVLHERAVILTYSDVQKYLKLLRRHGYPVRYFVTGEFGSQKGRAHWHIILHWQDKVPPHELDKVFAEEHWPHGWSYWTRPQYAAFRYNCKYILKDMGDDMRQGHLAMSKKPPLGAAYFEELAERYVMAGLAPQNLEYTFPDERRRTKSGTYEAVPFMLTGVSAELFVRHYLENWRAVHGDVPVPNSPMLGEFGDANKRARRRIEEWFAARRNGVAASASDRVQREIYLEQLGRLNMGHSAVERVGRGKRSSGWTQADRDHIAQSLAESADAIARLPEDEEDGIWFRQWVTPETWIWRFWNGKI